jgi:hypothetical protein
MDRKKTGNRTGPNRGPVYVTAFAAVVVDRSGCQFIVFQIINKPGKDRLRLVATGLLATGCEPDFQLNEACMV